MARTATANILLVRERTDESAWSAFWWIALCLAIPLGLSLFFFMGQSLRLDESQSLWQTSRSVTDIFSIVAGDVHVPLYHVLLHFWRLYVGDTVEAARAMSLLFFLLSIPALYMLGRYAYDRTIARYATLLFALSPFMNWYGNEIRMYTLFAFFVILNQYFFVKIFRNEGTETVWALYVLTALGGAFSHYFFFLSLFSQVVFYFLRRDLFPDGSFKRFILSAVIVVGAFAPWAWYVLHVGQAGFSEPTLPVPSSVNVFSAFSQFLFGFQNDNINTFFLSLWPIVIVLGILRLRRRKGLEPETQYFLATVVVSVAIAFIVSVTVAPIFVSRYLIFTVPSLYLLLASLLTDYTPRFGRSMRFSIIAVMVVMLGIEILNPTTPVKENYAEAAGFLNTHTTAQDAVVLSAPFTIYPVEHYYTGPAPLSTLPQWNQYAHGAIPAFNAQNMPQDIQQETNGYQNIYLLLSYDQGYEKTVHDYFESHYQRVYEQNFSSDLTIYVYKLKYGTDATKVNEKL